MRDIIDWQRLREVFASICRRWKRIGVFFVVYLVLFTEIIQNPGLRVQQPVFHSAH